MPYQEHWSAIRSRQSTNTPPASPTLARIRTEATRRGLYAAGPVTPPPPPAPAVPIGKNAALPPTSLSGIPVSQQAAEAKWASDPAIRAEFRDKARFMAFCRGVAAGSVRIAGRRVVTGSNP